MEKSIALISPNSDTFTNPTLTTLFQMLQGEHVTVLLFAPEQQPACPENIKNVIHIPSVYKLSLFRNPKYYLQNLYIYRRIIRTIKENKIKHLLAVDPLGLIIAGRVKKFLGKSKHLSYLSFEIFFLNELNPYYRKLKKKEIYYSQYINSILIQDEQRKMLLQKENHFEIKASNTAFVPVSPGLIKIENKTDIHQKFDIPKIYKLVVYSGSVGEWCGTGAIIEAFRKGYWNQHFWLIFHTRRPVESNDKFSTALTELHENQDMPFSLHANPFNSFDDLAVFLSGFDIALALYYPNNENPYYGMNMKEIGLSSGKFSMYMMLGLPTIITPCKIYNELIEKYNFGAVLQDIENIGQKLIELDSTENESFKLYDELLNPEKSLMNYMQIIRN